MSTFGDKVKVRGSVEGVCIAEAGLFEEGRKEENIPVVTTPQFRRFEFEVSSRTSKEPEIRAYNTEGRRDVYPVSDRESDRDDYDRRYDR